MFSGIVEEMGVVKRLYSQGGTSRLEVQASLVTQDTLIGDSVAVNGACLTVVENSSGVLAFDVMQETLKTTNLGKLRPLERVNLERALQSGKRISGHFVSGHVDTCALIRSKGILAGNQAFSIELPVKFRRNILPKGSITVDGISLTVAEIKPGHFTVFVIPHTFKTTTLSFKGPGRYVNLEFDMLVKAVINRDVPQRDTLH